MPAPAAFRTPLELGRTLRVRHDSVRLDASCPSLAADHCFGLLAIWSRGEIVGGAVFDLAPGERRSLRIDLFERHGRHGHHRRGLDRHGLTAQYWSTDDVGSATVPLSLRH